MASLTASSALSACGDNDNKDEAQADAGPLGANPLVPEIDSLPFPSDFYLSEDSSTATGRIVDIPEGILPAGIPSSVVAGHDGFSRMPVIATYLPGGVDPQSLLALDDHAGSIEEDAPVQLIEEGTWKRIPILAESDLTAQRDQDRALIIRPLQLLDANKGYVVVLRNTLRSYTGESFEASPAFLALRDGTSSSDPNVEAQRESFVLVNQAISEAGIEATEVVQAWSFHTRSEEQGSSRLLAMQKLTNEASLGNYEIISDEIQMLDDGASNRQIVATFEAPNFLDENNRILVDSDGEPMLSGTRDVEFSITIPSAVDETRPVILYGHGFFGSWDQATRGSVNDIGHEFRFSSVGTKIGFNEDLEADTLQGVTDLRKLEKIVHKVQQNICNQTALARLVREQLSEDITMGKGKAAFTPLGEGPVNYYGISNGGTFGFLANATSPQFERAALLVGGGGLIHFLERAVQWNEFGGIVNQAYREPRERQVVFSIIQMIMDPIDPITYARHLVHDRYEGLPPLKALVVMAVNDSQVRNLVSEWVARTADIPLVVPAAKEIFGLRQKSAEAKAGLDEAGGFFVYDEGVSPTPLGNLPPTEDNDTHGTSRYIESFRQQMGTFMESGALVQYCDGPCDPN